MLEKNVNNRTQVTGFLKKKATFFITMKNLPKLFINNITLSFLILARLRMLVIQ